MYISIDFARRRPHTDTSARLSDFSLMVSYNAIRPSQRKKEEEGMKKRKKTPSTADFQKKKKRPKLLHSSQTKLRTVSKEAATLNITKKRSKTLPVIKQ